MIKKQWDLFRSSEWFALLVTTSKIMYELPNEPPATINLFIFLTLRTLGWYRLADNPSLEQMQAGCKFSTKRTLYRSLNDILAARTFLCLPGSGKRNKYIINLTGILEYHLLYGEISDKQKDYIKELYLKAQQVMGDLGIDSTISIKDKNMQNLQDVVDKAKEESDVARELKMESKKVSATTQRVIDFIHEKAGKVSLNDLHNPHPRVYGKIANYIKECMKEERDIFDTLLEVINNWQHIIFYLKDLTKSTVLFEDMFEFESFYNYRGYVYDFMVACDGDYENYLAMEVFDKLNSMGIRQVPGIGHRINIKNWKTIEKRVKSRGDFKVVDEEGNDITQEIIDRPPMKNNFKVLDMEGNDITHTIKRRAS
jgi:uncharacterized protein YnzC (UPF0291/DUF896 family)